MPRQKLASPASTARSSKLSCALIGCGTETVSQAESSYAASSTLTPAVSTLALACASGIAFGALTKRQSALSECVAAVEGPASAMMAIAETMAGRIFIGFLLRLAGSKEADH